MFNLATALISLERMVATGNLVEMEVQQLRREFGTAAVFCSLSPFAFPPAAQTCSLTGPLP